MSFFDYLSPFCFLLIECQCTFIISYKILQYYVFWLGCDSPSALLFIVPVLLLSVLTPLFLPSSSVSLYYFILVVPMQECFEKRLLHEFPISYRYTEWYLLLSRGEIVLALAEASPIKIYIAPWRTILLIYILKPINNYGQVCCSSINNWDKIF